MSIEISVPRIRHEQRQASIFYWLDTDIFIALKNSHSAPFSTFDWYIVTFWCWINWLILFSTKTKDRSDGDDLEKEEILPCQAEIEAILYSCFISENKPFTSSSSLITPPFSNIFFHLEIMSMSSWNINYYPTSCHSSIIIYLGNFQPGSQTIAFSCFAFTIWVKVEGFPSGVSGKVSACQWRRCKRHRFDTWVGKIPQSKKWQPTPVFLPGKSHGQRNLVDYSPWSRKESDTAEGLSMSESWDLDESLDPKRLCLVVLSDQGYFWKKKEKLDIRTLRKQFLYWFLRAAITQYHRLGNLNNRSVLSLSAEG